MTDLSVFETTCPEHCPQFKRKKRDNCVGCPGHKQCPLQNKALAAINLHEESTDMHGGHI